MYVCVLTTRAPRNLPEIVKRNRSQRFPVYAYQVKSLIRYHLDMVTYSATSDVKTREAERHPLHAADLPLAALPNVSESSLAENTDTGVSTHNAPLRTDDKRHWYALRTTYGRERKAYDYLTSHGVEAYLPLVKTVKIVDGKRTTVVEPRIPNVFFARGTEDELKVFVYDNVRLPFLRFYYRRTNLGRTTVNVPLIVPDSQMASFRIICNADTADIVITTEVIARFRKGQRVRITDGQFAGVTGVVARYQSQQRVGIIIDGLLTACTAYVPNGFLWGVGEAER